MKTIEYHLGFISRLFNRTKEGRMINFFYMNNYGEYSIIESSPYNSYGNNIVSIVFTPEVVDEEEDFRKIFDNYFESLSNTLYNLSKQQIMLKRKDPAYISMDRLDGKEGAYKILLEPEIKFCQVILDFEVIDKRFNRDYFIDEINDLLKNQVSTLY